MQQYRIEIVSTCNHWESHCAAIVPECERESYLAFIKKRKRQSFNGPAYKVKVTKL